MKIQTTIAALLLIWLSLACQAAPLDATEIFTKAYEIKRVDDQIATLTFTFSGPGRSEQRVVYTMVWKNTQGKGDYDNKAIFFTEYPPEKKGIAYLGWLRPLGSGKQDEEWIYLPELRMTRRIAHHDHAHDDDEFGSSLLTREHLEPRPPHLDRHEMIGEQPLNDRQHYLIVSVPKESHSRHQMTMSHDPIGRTIRWIDKETFHTDRIQFFDNYEEQVLDMQIEWTQQGNYWIWKSVTATDPRNQAKTVLEISDIRINSGLEDREFNKRNLDSRPEHLR